jgi:hypothetical protein
MGIQGTEMAKESSNIVILDGNFTFVMMILRWRRCVTHWPLSYPTMPKQGPRKQIQVNQHVRVTYEKKTYILCLTNSVS